MYPLRVCFVLGICVWIPCIKETNMMMMMMMMMMIIIIIITTIIGKFRPITGHEGPDGE